MRRSVLLSAGLLSVAIALPGAAHADTMRCGQRIVTEGNSTYDVKMRCGEPVMANRRTELRSQRIWLQDRSIEQMVEVVIEEWTYDFGPTKFIMYLTFEQGRLISVVSGPRGEKTAGASKPSQGAQAAR